MIDALSATQIAMDIDTLKLQTLSQNISNMNTPGFKRQILDTDCNGDSLQTNLNHAIEQIRLRQVMHQGTFAQTNRAQDLALSGGGYFQVQGAQGLFYTRRGDFEINEQGELVTKTGERVLGKNGMIKLDTHSFTIDEHGSIFVNHQQVDELNLVEFNNQEQLRYTGHGLYETDEAPNPCSSNIRVLQGFIEQSNVKSVDEMMDLVSLSRHFEINQRIMRTTDSLLASAINQLGEGNV